MSGTPESKQPATVIIYEDDHHEGDPVRSSTGVIVHRDEKGRLTYTPPPIQPETESEEPDTTPTE